MKIVGWIPVFLLLLLSILTLKSVRRRYKGRQGFIKAFAEKYGLRFESKGNSYARAEGTVKGYRVECVFASDTSGLEGSDYIRIYISALIPSGVILLPEVDLFSTTQDSQGFEYFGETFPSGKYVNRTKSPSFDDVAPYVEPIPIEGNPFPGKVKALCRSDARIVFVEFPLLLKKPIGYLLELQEMGNSIFWKLTSEFLEVHNILANGHFCENFWNRLISSLRFSS